MLANRESALLDREHLAFLLAAHLVQTCLRSHVAVGKIPRPRHLAPGEGEQLLLVLQRNKVVPVAQRLVLQIGLEPGQLGVTLGDNKPDFAIVEGEQAIVDTDPLPFEDIDRVHVGGYRRGQVRDSGGVDEGEEQELGRDRSRLDRLDRHRPRTLLDPERLTLGFALDQRRHPADAGDEDQQR